jgi:hypothetical protein
VHQGQLTLNQRVEGSSPCAATNGGRRRPSRQDSEWLFQSLSRNKDAAASLSQRGQDSKTQIENAVILLQDEQIERPTSGQLNSQTWSALPARSPVRQEQRD